MKRILYLTVLTVVLGMSFAMQAMTDTQMQVIETADLAYKRFADVVSQAPVAYLEKDIRKNILRLQDEYPSYQWSKLFCCLCKDMEQDANVALHEQVKKVVEECLACCAQQAGVDAACKKEVDAIQENLREYQEFLASSESCLNLQDEMMTKRRCCRPAVNCFNIAPFIPFLPTGPIVPVTNNFVYAVRQETIDMTITPTAVVFVNPPVMDNNWTFDGTSTFTAQNSGTYLISDLMSYIHPQDGTAQGVSVLTLQPVLNGSVIGGTPVFYFDDYSDAGITFDSSFQLANTFIAQVNAGNTLVFQNFVNTVTATPTRTLTPIPTGAINGSVTIVRIQ